MIKNLICSEDGKRLDVYLTENLNDITRSKIKKLIDEGLISVNNKKVKKAGQLVNNGDCIRIELKEEISLNANPEDIPLDILFENNNLLVINKPQGMCVHPAVGNFSGTLVNALTYKIKTLSSINGDFRPGIVHRLDKDTSGVILVAKNDFAHVSLANQISNKTCKRFYLALLEGNLKNESGIIETFLTRSEKDRKKYDVSMIKGKLAITKYKVLKRYKGFCFVEFELKTGRTHQIRAHAKYLGHPVVGDKVYGFKKDYEGVRGQLLHAYKITFFEPSSKEELTFTCDLPKYFKDFINKLTQ